MDISSSGPAQPGPIGDQHRVQSLAHVQRRAAQNVRHQFGADEVTLSDQARLLQELARAVRDAPDVREERVAELQEAIRQGTYQVSATEIARALLASRAK